MNKKKNILTTALAVTLAVALFIGGGTFAYLKDETTEVVNSFKTNQVSVDLYETNEDDEQVTSNDYNIIPGTSQSKDPTVTVTATVDAYVFIKVTDTTSTLVDWKIDESYGWTALEGYDDVYYIVVEASDEEQTLGIIADNKVSYDKGLENSDMLVDNGDGTYSLKDDVQLTFQAYVIQQAAFESAADAYEEAVKAASDETVTTD